MIIAVNLKKFTAMIILHFHLQPQFKNELFHILHIKTKYALIRELPSSGSSYGFYLSIIPRVRVGYEMVDSQQGA